MIKLVELLKEVRYKSLTAENLKLAKQLTDQGQLSREDLTKLAEADPTSQKKYVGWMAKIWISEHPNLDDLKNTIKKYDTLVSKDKIQTKDINQFKSFEALKNEIDSIEASGEAVSTKELANDYETIVDNENMLIMVPHTHEASRKLGISKFAYRNCRDEQGNLTGGKDSAWCTTHKDPKHWHDHYGGTYGTTLYYVRVRSPKLMQNLKKAFPRRYKQLEVCALEVRQSGRIWDGYDGKDKDMMSEDIDNFLKAIGLPRSFFKPKRSPEERATRTVGTPNRLITQYIENGSKGNLTLSHLPVSSLPANLKVNGKLILVDCKALTALPTGLVVTGTLEIRDTPITTLPPDIKVGGLKLSKTGITSLPENLKVRGHLEIPGSKIGILPQGLRVGGDLDVQGTPITSLPEDLKIGKTLDISYTAITNLPSGLTYIKGDLYMSNTKITTLPKNLRVDGSMSLSKTPSIRQLPEGLEVKGINGFGLNINDTSISELPADIKITELSAYNTPLSKKYTGDQIRQMYPELIYVVGFK